MGAVWERVGKATGRADITAHSKALLAAAPQLYSALHTSLKSTVHATGNPAAPRCWPFVAEGNKTAGQYAQAHRAYPELCYSGALTSAQVDDIYTYMSNQNQSITLGIPGTGTASTHASAGGDAGGDAGGGAGESASRASRPRPPAPPPAPPAKSISTRSPFGLAYALLQHDMIERFLVHFYAMSAHAYTRGTWTTPESSNIADRDTPTVAYAVTGVATVPTYLKWMLLFEEPESKTLWVGKAVPRDWLAAGQTPVAVNDATTRYGRVSFSLTAPETSHAAHYTVKANVTLPKSFATNKPAGGLRLRIRAPLEHMGKLSSVTVGGQVWTAFTAADETIEFAADKLTAALIQNGLPAIEATFATP